MNWIPTRDLTAHHVNFAQLAWYIGITEFVTFCAPPFHFKELQHEIQSDQIHLALLRPCPVWVIKLGEWGGRYVGRCLVLAVPGFALTYFTAGQSGLGLGALLGVVVSLPLAGMMLLAINFLIGASCLWLKQAEPAHWIVQKSLFLLGALLWPLALYPAVMSKLVWLTPFPAILAVPGDWAVTDDAATHIGGFLHQMFWFGLFVLLVAAMNRAVLRRIQGGEA